MVLVLKTRKQLIHIEHNEFSGANSWKGLQQVSALLAQLN